MESTLLKGLSEMVASEQHLCSAVEIQEEDSVLEDFPDVLYLLSRIRASSEEHLEELHRLVEYYGGTSSALNGAVTVMTGTALAVANKLRPHLASRILRDDYVALSTNAVGYESLHATGLALGCKRTSDIALRHLRNDAGLILEISQAILPVVVHELGEEHEVKPGAAGYACMNVKQAWRFI